jgi:hypothetical protein
VIKHREETLVIYQGMLCLEKESKYDTRDAPLLLLVETNDVTTPQKNTNMYPVLRV